MISYRQADLLDAVKQRQLLDSLRLYSIPIYKGNGYAVGLGKDPKANESITVKQPGTFRQQTVTPDRQPGLKKLKEGMDVVLPSFGFEKDERYQEFHSDTGYNDDHIEKLMEAVRHIPGVAGLKYRETDSNHDYLEVGVYNI
jgi:hypothetical protein